MDVTIETVDEKRRPVRALFDTGAHVTLLREDCLPEGAVVPRPKKPRLLRTAARNGTLRVVGGLILVVTIGDRMIQTHALVSPDLAQELIIGAGTMQEWHITISNGGGETRVHVGLDLRDPDVQEVD